MLREKVQSLRFSSIFAFSFFTAWLISFAYQGQILYSLFNSFQIDPKNLVLLAILFHAAGLFIGGFIVKTTKSAKTIMLVTAGLCAALSGVFFFTPSLLWTISLIVVSLLSGAWNAAWGWFYRSCSSSNQRMRTVAASIAIGTTLMIGLNMTAIHLLPQAGLGLAVLCLAVSIFFIARLPQRAFETYQQPAQKMHIRQPYMLLCLFIVVITINSGLMFSMVNPAFAHLTTLTSWYWAVPYIVAILAVAWFPRKVNRSYILYISIAMQGFGFIFFLILNRSVASYLLVNTLLLGAFGINDLFWWSILGEMLDYHKNPAKLLGVGLFANVAGVLMGELISGLAAHATNGYMPTMLGLAVVCVALVILPMLYKQLAILLNNSAFLEGYTERSEQKVAIDTVLHAAELTGRENQIVTLLLKGYTYRLIAQELHISESTVKTHIQNLYGKLGVRGRAELIQKLEK